MANNDLTRLSKRVVQYFWDPLARNEDSSAIWCLGCAYDSPYKQNGTGGSVGLSGSAKSDSSTSQADSAVVTEANDKVAQSAETRTEQFEKSQGDASRTEDEEDLGWPPHFLDDLESRISLTYRSNFPAIPKSSDPAAASSMSFSTRLRNIGNQSGFTSDTGWGCMIRSGQSLLANALLTLKLGRDWRKGQKEQEHRDLLSLFADVSQAPFSIQRFVEHGAQACGKHPGEWFGPSASARCIQTLANKYSDAGLRVYARPDDSDVYVDSLFETASQKDADDKFQPTLIVLGVRLGIDRITPVYHAALKAALEMPQSVGIAGGRPNSSHYFVGHQSDQFFYLDPHSTRPMLSPQPSAEDVETCHTRRVRRIKVSEMDPSMLIGFLIHSKEEFEQWRRAVTEVEGKPIIHVADHEPKYVTGAERPGALDEVETWDETGDDDEVAEA